ncbi:hypothetical protein [Marinicrinis sediminis]|uniref:Uncharacterized protein n=1 Tax=Marinicrinis sediminis TaxID=1652465 RepID=A0ABW5R4P6_9BACL
MDNFARCSVFKDRDHVQLVAGQERNISGLTPKDKLFIAIHFITAIHLALPTVHSTAAIRFKGNPQKPEIIQCLLKGAKNNITWAIHICKC